MADATVTLKFKWIQTSPEPHDLTMRNTLEPEDVVVQVEIPLKHEYVANSEEIIKTKVGVDGKKEDKPILTSEGMKYAISQLSLESAFEPETEEEDWEDAGEEWEDSSEENTEEDFDWEEE